MKFISAEPTEDYPVRFVSEQGKWQIGILPTISGTHCIGISEVGSEGMIRHYCCGGDVSFAQEVLRAIQDIFWVIPEEATAQAVEEELPGDGGNIANNGIWDTLRHMARMIRYVRQQTQSKGVGI